jgi:hypothetical protein
MNEEEQCATTPESGMWVNFFLLISFSVGMIIAYELGGHNATAIVQTRAINQCETACVALFTEMANAVRGVNEPGIGDAIANWGVIRCEPSCRNEMKK